jgi:hypothetical protein
MGFTRTTLFGSYTEDPFSLFIEKKLPKSSKNSIKELTIEIPIKNLGDDPVVVLSKRLVNDS